MYVVNTKHISKKTKLLSWEVCLSSTKTNKTFRNNPGKNYIIFVKTKEEKHIDKLGEVNTYIYKSTFLA